MAITYTQTENSIRCTAVGDHAGYTARVVTGWDAKSDAFPIHVYIGKQGDDGQEATAFKKIDATDLSAKNVQDGFEQGFALAERTIDEVRGA